MLHVGLDLSRQKVDVCVLDDSGLVVGTQKFPPDEAGLDRLVTWLAVLGQVVGESSVRAVVESMTGARFVRDHLVGRGWRVMIADAARAKALAPLTAKTDRIDAFVLAELSRRDLVPEIWLPGMGVRQLRELTRCRAHLVKHRTMLKNRIHQTLVNFGIPCPVSDLFGVTGRTVLAGLELPGAWAVTVTASLTMIDALDAQIEVINGAVADAVRQLPGLDAASAEDIERLRGYVRRLRTVPGVGPVLALTIALEVGDITRFRSPAKFVGYTGLCPSVHQSGSRQGRGKLTKHGPKYLRWALIEATIHARRHPFYADRYRITAQRMGRFRRNVARVDLARRIAHDIYWMLTKNADFAPAGARLDLTA